MSTSLDATPADFRPVTAPADLLPEPHERGVAEYASPAVFRVANEAQIEQAPGLGFTHILLPHSDMLPLAQATSLGPLLEISLEAPAPGAEVLELHPDWFVHGPQGPVFRYLSEYDETAIWWDQELARFQQLGASGFYIAQAHRIAPAILRHLIAAALARAPDCLFIAEVFGAAPGQISNMAECGFSLITSSSCFWDFSASWLNADSARIAAIAPALALAAPPRGLAPDQTAARRALRLAASFAPGWLMEAGFQQGDGFDLSDEVRSLNALRAELPALRAPQSARLVSSPGTAIAVLSRGPLVTLANASLLAPATMQAGSFLPALGASQLNPLGATTTVITPAGTLTLSPGQALFYQAAAASPVLLPAPKLDCAAPRIAIEAISPAVDGGKYPARRVAGERVAIEADLIADGHDKLAGEVLLRAADEKSFRVYPLTLLNNDRWRAEIPLERLGRHFFIVTAWKDRFASFTDELAKKHAAGVPTQLELREGLLLVEEAAERDKNLRPVLQHLRAAPEESLRQALLSNQMGDVMRRAAPRNFLIRSAEIPLDCERAAAAFASWYEIFPRSQSGDANLHGTFQDVIGQLPRIAAMGFDVLYFPPIHPIGHKNRKGKNNSLTPGPDDPGSPYAIGSDAGGHDALHPELGTFEDFASLISAAKEHGLEIALDFAIQCAPDHPWLKQHKNWFDWRPDGSLRYAENPPKKYEDIVNVDFYTTAARPALWLALRDVVQFWIDQGIKIFRVDNPHTKPFPFWEWMIADIRSRHPDTIFLAEAFTRPKIMAHLAKIGFSQSYTYFTWRNTKAEFEEYLTELTGTELREYFRPNFFVNTPDINPPFLQTSGRAGHLIRAALAATLAGLWGVYNGFELCEATPIPGREEYLDSEKYEIKAWDYARSGNIVQEITALNRIRWENAALHSHRAIKFLNCDNPNVLYFSKTAADGNTLLIAISLDPFNIQDTTIELPNDNLAAEDLMRGTRFTWHGKYEPVRLDPSEMPFCIWRAAPATS